MDNVLDLSRWREAPLGVLHRRWAMVWAGLRQLLRTRFFRILVFLAWSMAFAIAVIGFLFTQSIATGGWLETFAAGQGPRFQAVASAFSAIVLLYPDICIGGMFSVLFWAQAKAGFLFSLLALSAIVPNLITRDRATHALAIYFSRPLTSLDYLLGKLGVILGVLVLVWTGPLLFSWALSMLVAPGTDFLVYSLEPLGRALLFNGIALVTLAAVAMGVSSITRSARGTVFLWIGLWVVAGTIATFPTTPDWLRAASFSYDLSLALDAIFDLSRILSTAASSIPLLSADVSNNLNNVAEHARVESLDAAILGLPLLIAGSAFLLFRRLRPE